MKNLKRTCPKCDNEILYVKKQSFVIANEKQTLCRSCCKKGHIGQ